MTHKGNSGPAFPHPSGEFNSGDGGMTLRDWLAGQALVASWFGFDKGYYEGGKAGIAECAYQLAGAMLEASSK